MCQIDQGGWTGEVTRQRVLVQWHNKKGGQGVSARGWEGQAAARGREGRQGGGKGRRGQGEGTPLSQSTARSVGAPALLIGLGRE